MKEIKKQMKLIDDVIINIDMAKDRLENIYINLDNLTIVRLFGQEKLEHKLYIKTKALQFWKRKLKRELKNAIFLTDIDIFHETFTNKNK